MLCDDCKQQPAAIHLTQTVNGKKTELHLCMVCANRRNIQILPVAFIPGFVLNPGVPAFSVRGGEERTCAKCGYTWREFTATGFLGCVDCYQSFGDLLSQVIAKNQGNVRHQGKYPARGGGPLRVRRQIAALRNELEKSVQTENFEQAARLRDQIKTLEQQT